MYIYACVCLFWLVNVQVRNGCPKRYCTAQNNNAVYQSRTLHIFEGSEWNYVGLGLGYLALSFIASSSNHTFTQISHGRTRPWECVFDARLRFSCPAFPNGPMSISSWQTPPPSARPPFQHYQHFQLVSQSLQVRFNGCHKFLFSRYVSVSLLTVTSLVSGDRVTGETRPQTGPVREKRPKCSPNMLSPKKLLLHFNYTVVWLIMNKTT